MVRYSDVPDQIEPRFEFFWNYDAENPNRAELWEIAKLGGGMSCGCCLKSTDGEIYIFSLYHYIQLYEIQAEYDVPFSSQNELLLFIFMSYVVTSFVHQDIFLIFISKGHVVEYLLSCIFWTHYDWFGDWHQNNTTPIWGNNIRATPVLCVVLFLLVTKICM